ncbi:hypothetical protein CK507_05335 [Pseudomonas sp. WN033]|nr:hypothetical protein CK507_05335 [Pseudomonas sp. WN033]
MSSVQPISHAEVDTLSFRQLDQLNALPKGSCFKLFKRCQSQLLEGRDYFYLPATEHQALINQLKLSGQIYASTVHLVLLTRDGYARLRELGGSQL